jgi:hypothetical protein
MLPIAITRLTIDVAILPGHNRSRSRDVMLIIDHTHGGYTYGDLLPMVTIAVAVAAISMVAVP